MNSVTPGADGRPEHEYQFGGEIPVAGVRTLGMLRGPFDGRIRVRTGEAGPELRVTGLPVQPEGWQPFRIGD